MKRMAPRAQSKAVKELNGLFVLAALVVVDIAGLVNPVPVGVEPDAEVIEEEPDGELGRVVLVPLAPDSTVLEPDPTRYVGEIPVAGIVAVDPPELSTTDIGINSVEYSVEIVEADPDPRVD